jgi:hypothetical protein
LNIRIIHSRSPYIALIVIFSTFHLLYYLQYSFVWFRLQNQLIECFYKKDESLNAGFVERKQNELKFDRRHFNW